MSIRLKMFSLTKRTLFYNIFKKFRHLSNLTTRDALFVPIQKEPDKKPRKISIIGAAGNIGQIMSYDLLIKKICDELVLCDISQQKSKLCGLALDLLDGTSFRNHPKLKICINEEHSENSDLLIICVGSSPKKKQKRLDVLKENADYFKIMIPKLAKLSPNSIIIVVSNPVDVMTYAAWKFSGFPSNRVLGTGTCLDTSRLQYFLSKKLGISPKSINAWMIGEHGGSTVTCWSTINIAGTRLRECKECFGLKDDAECWKDLEKKVIKQGFNVYKLRGFTSSAITMVVSELAEAVLMDKRIVYPVSTNCDGMYGLKIKCFLSLPAVIGNKGVHQIIKIKLDPEEYDKFKNSAQILDKAVNSYNWDLKATKKEEKKSKSQQCQQIVSKL